jgi:hypothetical protein
MCVAVRCPASTWYAKYIHDFMLNAHYKINKWLRSNARITTIPIRERGGTFIVIADKYFQLTRYWANSIITPVSSLKRGPSI